VDLPRKEKHYAAEDSKRNKSADSKHTSRMRDE
jgi:hypothetical protein